MDKKVILTISGIVAMLMIGGSYVTLMEYDPYDADTDTLSFSHSCQNWRGLGGFPDKDGDRTERGELFYTTKGLTSWLSDGKSQTIIVQAEVKRDSSWACDDRYWFTSHRYVFEINEGRGWEPLEDPFIEDPPMGMEAGIFKFKQKIIIDGQFSLKSVAFEIDGIIRDGAVLRVTYEGWISISEHIFDPGEEKWRKLASDEMILRQGIPLVEFGSGQYAVGETAILTTEIPFVHFDDGNFTEYYLSVYNQNTGDECKDDSNLLLDRVPIEKVKKVWKIPVTSDMFIVTPDCQNRLRAVIRNELLNADQDDTSVIDIAGYGPTVTKVESDKAEYEEGDTVTITWEAEPNNITELPIIKYHITAHIAGLVLMDQDTTETSAFFRAPTTGFLEVEVTAYDEGCRPSEIIEIVLEVGNVLPPKHCEMYPNDPICKPKGEPFPWVEIILTIGILILAFIIGYILYLLIPFGDAWKALGFIVPVLAGAILAGMLWL